MTAGEVEAVHDVDPHARTSHGYFLEYKDEREQRDLAVNVTRCAFCGFTATGPLAETRAAFREHRRSCRRARRPA